MNKSAKLIVLSVIYERKKMTLLIKNGRLVDPKSNRDEVLDILIENDKIVKIGLNLSVENAEIVDARGLVVAPGLIDVHVHFREPGQTHKETIHSGAKSAAAGGFTRVVMMANTKPILSTPKVLTETLEIADKEDIKIDTVGSITQDFDGEHLTDFDELIKAGAIGFSDDGIPLTDAGVLRKALQKAKLTDSLISIHEEDPNLIGTLGVNDGEVAHKCGFTGAPTVSEYSMMARDTMIAYETGARLHIQHLSAGESVEVVRFAKNLGAKITAEVTPQHFSITEQMIFEQGTNAKLNPPLRRTADIGKIIEGLKDGTIDVIATDHAPHTHEEKNVSLDKAPSGMIGLETSLQLGLTNLVAKGHLKLSELLTKMTVNPAKLYNFDAGYLAENGPADLVIFDAENDYQVGETFDSKATNSPFIKQKVQGQVKYTICDGKIVYQAK
ncbi:dihydroorotase [Lactococcus lactis subsp. lactis]|uniref:Dihydroorotase n=2 Tax=Lactococcus lactis TaxID=1358 RepID=A0A552Z5F0_9LACT|nr:dihydroorotase [Lactococcus lactis subsp. lactis]MCT0441688.1 dihydroorotase [Lactococcus lactis subsp. lactis]MCT1180551.1 dihydroorotase [Lactococcus lactis]TRW74744.1 dihydroorotase [Lactococcus lactis]